MSEYLQEAAAMARLERRRRLIRDVAHMLGFGEDVLQIAAGRGGAPPREGAAIQLAITDRRLLVVRRRAFRQVTVESFEFADSFVSYGYSSAGDGVLEVRDAARRVRVGGISEGELEPFLSACRARLDASHLEVLLERDEAGSETEPAEAAEIVTPEAEPGVAEAAPTPEAEPGVAEAAPTPEAPVEAAATSAAGTTLVLEETGPTTIVLPETGLAPVPTGPPDTEERSDPAAEAQGAILRWLLVKTRASSAVFAPAEDGTGLRIEPRRLDADEAVDLLRRARAVRTGERDAGLEPADSLAARWVGRGGPKALLLTGVDPGRATEPAAFAQFVLESLDASRSATAPGIVGRIRAIDGVTWAEVGPAGSIRALVAETADLDQVGDQVLEVAEAEGAPVEWVGNSLPRLSGDRPAIAAVEVTGGVDGRPAASVRLDWMGDSMTGQGRGHTEILGRHLAVARATAAALESLVARRVVVEHLFVTYPPTDAELVVVTVLVGSRRYVGAAAVPDGGEDAAGASAVLDALNRLITRLGPAPTPR